MSKTVALQIDPLESLNFTTDSTLLIANELQSRGYELFSYSPEDLSFEQGHLHAMGSYIELDYKRKTFAKLESKKVLLKDFQIIFVRQNPPFDQKYLTATYMLETLRGPTIINDPQAIRNISEKLCIMNFPKLIPDTIVTNNHREIKNFLVRHNVAIAKSLYGFGGADVVKLTRDDKDIDAKINLLLEKYGHLMVQEFLSDVNTLGDKRVMIMEGEVIGAINRMPSPEDFRANLVLGGKAYSTTLTEKEIEICAIVGHFLKSKNLFLAGVDLIAEKLIEINVTSPTGLVAINNLHQQAIEKIIVDKIETKVKY